MHLNMCLLSGIRANGFSAISHMKVRHEEHCDQMKGKKQGKDAYGGQRTSTVWRKAQGQVLGSGRDNEQSECYQVLVLYLA